jgi:DNA polymerase III sliding clamp (beta) subunit (PCNA family)
MAYNREQLISALAAVKPGLANKETLEQSSSFVFTEGLVFTYNDSIMVSHPFEASDGWTCVVDAKLLYSYLTKVKGKEVKLSSNDKELHIEGKRSKAKIPSQFEISPTLKVAVEEQNSHERWYSLPMKFNEGLERCWRVAGKDATKPELMHIHINDLQMEACNGYKLIMYYLDKKMFRTPLLIPAKAAAELYKYKCDKFTVGEGWLHFKNTTTGIIFSCRTIKEEYPDLMKFVPKLAEELNLPRNFIDTLERARVFCEELNENIHIDITEGFLKTWVHSAHGQFEETNRVKYKGNVNFTIDPASILYIASKSLKIALGERVVSMVNEEMVVIGAIVREEVVPF